MNDADDALTTFFLPLQKERKIMKEKREEKEEERDSGHHQLQGILDEQEKDTERSPFTTTSDPSFLPNEVSCRLFSQENERRPSRLLRQNRLFLDFQRKRSCAKKLQDEGSGVFHAKKNGIIRGFDNNRDSSSALVCRRQIFTEAN